MRDWLIDIRNSQKATQEAVADKAGISRAFYTNIEMSKRNPHPCTAKKIAEVLGFDWTLFFISSDNKN